MDHAPKPIVRVPGPDAANGRPCILLLNASLAGPEGNSARLLARVESRLSPHAALLRAALAGPGAQGFAELEPVLRAADAFVLATGTH